MPDKERQPTYEEKKLRREEIERVLSDLSPEDTDQVLSRFSRRTFLIRSGKFALAAVGTGLAVGGVGGFGIGVNTGTQDERGRNFPKGVLTKELREIFKNDGIFVYEQKGETVASIRDYLDSIRAGFNIPPSLFAVPEGKDDPDTVAYPLNWLAIDPVNPTIGEGNEGVSGLQDLVREETANVQTLLGRTDIQIVSALKPIEIIGLELAYRESHGGESLFSQVSQEGGYIIIPGAKVGNGGLAVSVSESGVKWNVYNASSGNPAPPPYPLVAARVIGAK